ncbi:helix-turn-helix domain-containing protein (plasmid) [Azospirillum sp. A26]|uniref:GlxA family transcriptional regulator n=1 Tax=Azospirillum sp. A26 TaxID=3160607 RepID=UPI00366BD2F5
MIIRIWVCDGTLSSGVAGPVDVFAVANMLAAKRADPSGQPPLRWFVESMDGRPVQSASGQMIAVDGRMNPEASADAILVTAPYAPDIDRFLERREEVAALTRALRRQHERGAVLASYCTGNYLLAEAGLLDERPATTHWAKARDFTRRYPRVALRAQEILTEQDGILSGGSVTSYLTLAIRLVSRLSGAELAAATARMLLIDTNRVLQAPFATLIEEHGHGDRLVARAQRRMAATIQQASSLSELATHLAVSERTLNRRFKQAIGIGPLEYLQALRVEIAKQLLEAGTLSIDEICLRVGYADSSTFRALFKRLVGHSPREYQRWSQQLRPQCNTAPEKAVC